MTISNTKRRWMTIATSLFLSLSVTAGAAPAAISAPVPSSQGMVQQQEVDPELEEVFIFIESISDEVLLDEEAYDQWIQENMPTKWTTSERVNWVACGAAVGAALVGSLPPAKILKLKQTFKAAGGATKFFKTFKPAYDKARNSGKSYADAVGEGAKVAGGESWPEIQQALLDFFAVGAVAGACGVGE